jgi:hypothetical protein
MSGSTYRGPQQYSARLPSNYRSSIYLSIYNVTREDSRGFGKEYDLSYEQTITTNLATRTVVPPTYHFYSDRVRGIVTQQKVGLNFYFFHNA